MLPEAFVIVGLIPGLSLLPQDMDTPEARAFLLAIGLQESKLTYRRQIRGPARSYLMFERTGVAGVLRHPASRDHAADVLRRLDYGALLRQPMADRSKAVLAVLEHHDPLAIVFARLLIKTLPAPLPTREESGGAWSQYLDAWQPGKPRELDWAANFWDAWRVVDAIT